MFPRAASPTTSARCASASRRPASCSRWTSAAQRPTRRTSRGSRASATRSTRARWVFSSCSSGNACAFRATGSRTSRTGSPRPGARGATPRAFSSRSRRKGKAARTTTVRPSRAPGSGRRWRSIATRTARSNWCSPPAVRWSIWRASPPPPRPTNMRRARRPTSKPMLHAGRPARTARSCFAAPIPHTLISTGAIPRRPARRATTWCRACPSGSTAT